jgi:hypothetical protein
VRHIVNLALHTHEKGLPDAVASVSRLGITYLHIPVDFQNPTDQDFDPFCAAMEQLKEVLVHVHCIAHYRVSAFFYRYRRACLAWAKPRRVPTWSRFGTRRASGRRLSVARLTRAVKNAEKTICDVAEEWLRRQRSNNDD